MKAEVVYQGSDSSALASLLQLACRKLWLKGATGYLKLRLSANQHRRRAQHFTDNG